METTKYLFLILCLWKRIKHDVNVATRLAMGLLPDTQNSGMRMCRECRERFPTTAS